MNSNTLNRINNYIEQHAEEIENNKFTELFNNFNSYSEGFQWGDLLALLFEAGINPMELSVEPLPSDFFCNTEAPNLDLVVSENVTDILFMNCEYKNIKFKNPDCKVFFKNMKAHNIFLPEHVEMDGTGRIIGEQVDATVIVPSSVDAIEDGSISLNQDRLILNVDKKHIPEWGLGIYNNRNQNGKWSVNRNTVHVR